MVKLDLDGAWEFKASKGSQHIPDLCARAKEWLPATVPGTVHTDLMANGVIPDPFYRMNETELQWIDHVAWEYRRSFEVPDALLEEKSIQLCAEGLDTYAKIIMNGKTVGSAANMFVEHVFDIRKHLRRGQNTIEIHFDAPVPRSKALERQYGPLQVAHEAHRVYARKSQYSFGWDWGPTLTTSGIWRRIFIEGYTQERIRAPFARVLLLSAKEAVVRFSVEVEGERRPEGKSEMCVKVEGADDARAPIKGGKATVDVTIPRPRLWWPNGQGEQAMYKAALILSRGDTILDRQELAFAVRTVQLLQEKDEEGKSFILVVNGRKIFCKGADWIPVDSFLPRIEDSRYERLLRLAKDAHMNMLRVWGGGVYEDDRFYDLCDKYGLLVWQDFMFACGEYPDNEWFLDNVREEASRAVKRLRNHPCIAVWCGNNECEWSFCTNNPGKRPDDMIGATIFRDVLPEVCRRLDGTRPYWRSSPFGSGFPNDESNGNHHQWLVWSFWKDYPAYEKDNARFVTEFGFQAPANVKTMETCTLPEDRHPQSRVMEHHNKQIEGPERLFRFMGGHVRIETDLSRFTYLGQIVQAEALKCAVEHWRRRKFHTAGALFWQLNDCWPVSSWSVVDSGLRPKAAYFYAKRFFAPVLLSFKKTDEGADVWLTNDLPAPLSGRLGLSRRTFDGEPAWTREIPCHVPANSSKTIFRVRRQLLRELHPAREYLLGTWRDDNGTTSENRFFFMEQKHLSLPEPELSVEIRPAEGREFVAEVKAHRFARGVRLEISGEDAAFENNFVDIDAGSVRNIGFSSSSSLDALRKRLTLEHGR